MNLSEVSTRKCETRTMYNEVASDPIMEPLEIGLHSSHAKYQNLGYGSQWSVKNATI